MERVKEGFHNYLYFSPATTCIRGLIFSHSLVNHAVVSILITYLVTKWWNERFQMAAVVTNMQEGFTDMLVIILAHISGTNRGLFNIIVTTNAAYIAGLAILWRSAELMTDDTAAKVYYGAALLLIFGEAGRSAALKKFLDEQYSSEKRPEQIGREKLEDRQEALWGLPWFLGAVVPLFFLETTWEQIFMVSTILMGVCYFFFCWGYSFYFINSTEEPMPDVEGAEGEENDTDTNVNIWSLIRKMKARHVLRKILAMWLTFLVYSVVSAAGSTFFFEQLDTLSSPIKNYDVAVYFNVISSISKYATSYLWELIVPKERNSRALMLGRIGCGQVFTVLCCVMAWLVETFRLEEVRKQSPTSEVIPMSIFWLVPQFSLLGIMEGLVVDGLIDFFVDRVAHPQDKVIVEYYASHTSDFVIGVGKLLTALSILAFRQRWFDDNINMSRLDKYYRALTFMSLIWFCCYLFVSTIYYSKDEENENRIENQESSPPSPQEPSQALQQGLPAESYPPHPHRPQTYKRHNSCPPQLGRAVPTAVLQP